MHLLLRFGLGTLLFLTACVAGFFGGYRSGYHHGAAEYLATQTTTEEYYVADLVTVHPKQEDIDFVTETLRETVGQRSDWAEYGGYASIEFNPEHLSLMVTHSQACHREIKAFLRTLRMGRSLDDPTANSSDTTSPQQIVRLDINGLLSQPERKQPGFQYPSIQAALQSAVPKAQFWGVTRDGQGLQVSCNFAEAHQMRTILAAMRELDYLGRFHASDGPDGITYVHDTYNLITWKQTPGVEMWTLHHSQ